MKSYIKIRNVMKKILCIMIIMLAFNANANDFLTDIEMKQIGNIHNYLSKIDTKNGITEEVAKKMFSRITGEKISKNIDIDFKEDDFDFQISYLFSGDENECVSTLKRVNNELWSEYIVNGVNYINAKTVKSYEFFDACTNPQSPNKIIFKHIKS